MKIKSLYRIVVWILTIVLFGCSDSWLEEETPQIITTESLYTSLAGFETGINGLYGEIRRERDTHSDIEMLGAVFLGGTDNLVCNHGITDGFTGVSWYWGTINNSLVNTYEVVFSWLYRVINGANTIINQAENRGDIKWSGDGSADEENKNHILAEARAIRAWAYRHLTYGWGDVPLSLVESSGTTIKTDWERAPVALVRKQTISDLLFAEKYIEVEPSMRGRFTKGAIQTYLSELYLVLNKPDSALYWADKVINTPEYKLVTARYGVRKDQPGVPVMDMFYEGNENRDQGNTEALWVWQYSIQTLGGGTSIIRRWHTGRFSDWIINGKRALRDTYERGGRGRSRESLTKWAIDLYEPFDDRATNHVLRKYFILNDAKSNAPYPADTPPPGYSFGDTIWLHWATDITDTHNKILDWPFSRKIEGTDPDNPGGGEQWNDQVRMRLAETYLLKAEAEYLLGRPDEAANTINIIRRRSNASDITAADVSIDFILDERSRELVVEEDRRWTLLRTKKWLERVQKYNKNGGQLITAKDTIFPIPQSVIDANITRPMVQNPGY